MQSPAAVAGNAAAGTAAARAGAAADGAVADDVGTNGAAVFVVAELDAVIYPLCPLHVMLTA